MGSERPLVGTWVSFTRLAPLLGNRARRDGRETEARNPPVPVGVLLSLAAWRALYQLARDPYRWEKTEHGLAKTSRMAEATPHGRVSTGAAAVNRPASAPRTDTSRQKYSDFSFRIR